MKSALIASAGWLAWVGEAVTAAVLLASSAGIWVKKAGAKEPMQWLSTDSPRMLYVNLALLLLLLLPSLLLLLLALLLLPPPPFTSSPPAQPSAPPYLTSGPGGITQTQAALFRFAVAPEGIWLDGGHMQKWDYFWIPPCWYINSGRKEKKSGRKVTFSYHGIWKLFISPRGSAVCLSPAGDVTPVGGLECKIVCESIGLVNWLVFRWIDYSDGWLISLSNGADVRLTYKWHLTQRAPKRSGVQAV